MKELLNILKFKKNKEIACWLWFGIIFIILIILF